MTEIKSWRNQFNDKFDLIAHQGSPDDLDKANEVVLKAINELNQIISNKLRWENADSEEIEDEFYHILIAMCGANGCKAVIEAVENLIGISSKRSFVIDWHENDNLDNMDSAEYAEKEKAILEKHLEEKDINQ